jgi:hypothetical protein
MEYHELVLFRFPQTLPAVVPLLSMAGFFIKPCKNRKGGVV